MRRSPVPVVLAVVFGGELGECALVLAAEGVILGVDAGFERVETRDGLALRGARASERRSALGTR